MVGLKGVQDIDDLGLQVPNAVFKGVWVGLEEAGEIPVILRANSFVGSQG